MVIFLASSGELLVLVFRFNGDCSLFAVEMRIVLFVDVCLSLRSLAHKGEDLISPQHGQNLLFLLFDVIFDRGSQLHDLLLKFLAIVRFAQVGILLSVLSFFANLEYEFFDEGRFQVAVHIVIRLVVNCLGFLAVKLAHLAVTWVYIGG